MYTKKLLQIKYIISALFNLIRKPFIKGDKLILYNKRYNICNNCEYCDKKLIKYCKHCGCPIRTKTMVDYPIYNNISIGGCPKYKW